jgi:dTDP-4-dehydrorhamnose reductase
VIDEKKTPRCVVLGANGQLGRALRRALSFSESRLVAAWGREELDVEDLGAVEQKLDEAQGLGAQAVLNAAAMTAVDRCEDEPDLAWRINAEVPGRIARVCAELELGFVHVSTDYVFSGRGGLPWKESDPTAPISVYGKSKLAGEERVRAANGEALIVRTAWLFGDGGNFVRTILAAAKRAQRGEGPAPQVVNDQHGSPTYAQHLAYGMLALLERRATGIYHLANSGIASWWDLARAALREAGLGVSVEAVSSDAFPRPAPRPAWSALDLGRAHDAGVAMPTWQEGLRVYLESPESPLRGGTGG